MHIYRDQSKGTGEFMSADQIGVRWPQTGLRASDLPPALESLKHRGLLVRHAGASADLFALTSNGTDWLATRPAWLEYQLLARRQRAQFLHDHPSRRVPVSGRRRRADTGLHQPMTG